MKWFKWTRLIAAAAALLLFSAPALAEPQSLTANLRSDTQLLIEKLKAARPSVEYVDEWDTPYIDKNREEKIIAVSAQKNTALHDNFKWNWSVYNFAFQTKEYLPGKYMDIVQASVRYYKESGDAFSRTFECVATKDVLGDGVLDFWLRTFEITVNPDRDDEDPLYYFLSPRYPEGFVNKQFYQLTRDQATEVQQEIVTYFLKLLGEEK